MDYLFGGKESQDPALFTFEHGVAEQKTKVYSLQKKTHYILPEVKFNDENEEVTISYGSKSETFSKEYCRKFIHEYSFRSMKQPSDVKLSTVFGANFEGSHLTPDFFLMKDDDHKVVYLLEVTTRRWPTKAGNFEEVAKKVEIYRNALMQAYQRTGYSTILYAICINQLALTGPEGLTLDFVEAISSDFQDALFLRSRLTEQDAPIYGENRQIIGHKHSHWFETEEDTKLHQEILFEFTKIKPEFDQGYWTEEFYNQCCNFNHTKLQMECMVKEAERWAAHKMIKLKTESEINPEDKWGAYVQTIRDNPRGVRKHSRKPIVFLPMLDFSEATGYALNSAKPFPMVGKRTTMQRVWNSAFEKASKKDWDSITLAVGQTILNSLINEVPDVKTSVSERRRHYALQLDLDPQDQLTLAQRGVEAKRFKEELMGQTIEDKKSLDPDTDISDIDAFIGNRTLVLETNDKLVLDETYKDLIADQISRPEVRHLADRMVGSSMFSYMRLISDIATELCLSVRTNLKRGQFLIKKIKNFDCFLLIKTTTSAEHVFFSICARLNSLKGRNLSSLDIFNEHEIIEREGTHWVLTKFWSFKQDRLSHLTKAAGMSFALLAATINHFTDDFDPSRLSIPCGDFGLTPDQNRIYNFCLLMYLENKPCTENAWTLIRYPYMESFKPMEIPIYPAKIISKFPDVLRSRLQIFCLKSIKETCKSLHFRRPVYDGKWAKIQCPILMRDVSAHQCIKSMFFGYVVSKELQSERNMSFQLAEKIYNFEEKFRKLEKKYQESGEIITRKDHMEMPDWHEYDYKYISVISRHLAKRLQSTMGPSWLTVMQGKILTDFKHQTISKVTTLKASASYKGQHRTDFFKGIDDLMREAREPAEESILSILDRLPGQPGSTYADLIKKRGGPNSKKAEQRGDYANRKRSEKNIEISNKILSKHIEWKSRPRVAEAFVLLRENLVTMGVLEEEETRLFMFVRPCLEILNKRGRIYVDLFRKAQHAGLREIYVIEISARIVQLFLESIARTYCKEFPSEVMENPKGKYEIPLNHYRECRSKFDKFVSLSDAADAAKWNNAHFVPKFADFLMKLVPKAFQPFIFQSMKLWTNKEIMLPIDLLISFQHNASASTGNDTYRRMRNEYLQSEEGGILEPNKISMLVKSGMMQGILHFVSSLLHTAHQEFIIDELLRAKQFERDQDFEVCCQQSSDDSSLIISFPIDEKGALMNPSHRTPDLSTMIQRVDFFYHLKDMLGRLAGIFESDEKTSRTLLFTHEFNTEFFLDSEWLRPTNKWIYASQSTLVVESFVERFEQNYNAISECLSGGSTSYEASLIQIGQAITHYTLLGLSVNPLAQQHSRFLNILPDPATGYFIMSSSVNPGIFGYNYELYRHLKKNESYSKLMKFWLDEISKTTAGQLTRGGSRMFGIKIRMGNLNIYDGIMSRMGMNPQIEDILENNPDVLFREPKTWSETQLHIYHKMTAPSVVQSLSQHCAEARMVAAAGYLMHTKCVTTGFNWRKTGEKFTLPAIWMKMYAYSHTSKPLDDDELLRLFPLKNQYEEALIHSNMLEVRPMTYGSAKTKSRMRITVTRALNDLTIRPSSYCSYMWWRENRPMGNLDYINYQWKSLKFRFDFLRDSWKETREHFGEDVRAVEICDLVLRLTAERDRVLFLTSSVGANHTFSIYSLMARNFCHNFELRAGIERILTSDKVNFYIMALCQTGSKHENIKTCFLEMGRKDPWLRELEWKEDSPYFPLVVMRDLVNQDLFKFNEENSQALSTIWSACSRHKRGVIGRFIQDENKDLGQEGIWEGNVGDTPCRITGLYNQCKSIAIRDLRNKIELEPLLNRLLKDLGWTEHMAITSEYVFTGFKLLIGGSGIPVTLNNEMKFLVKPPSCELFFDANPHDLRLKLRLGSQQALQSGKDTFTIFSYRPRPEGMSFSQAHPNLGVFANTILEGAPIKMAYLSAAKTKLVRGNSFKQLRDKPFLTTNEYELLRTKEHFYIHNCKVKWLRKLFTLSLRKCYQTSKPAFMDLNIDDEILDLLMDDNEKQEKRRQMQSRLVHLRSLKTGKISTAFAPEHEFESLSSNLEFVKNLDAICGGLQTIVTTRIDRLLNSNIYNFYSADAFKEIKKELSERELQTFMEDNIWPHNKKDLLLRFVDHLQTVPRIEVFKKEVADEELACLAEEDMESLETGSHVSYLIQGVVGNSQKIHVPLDTEEEEMARAVEAIREENEKKELERLKSVEEDYHRRKKEMEKVGPTERRTREWVYDSTKSWAEMMEEDVEADDYWGPEDQEQVMSVESETEDEDELIEPNQRLKDLGYEEEFKPLRDVVTYTMEAFQERQFVEIYNEVGQSGLWHWAIKQQLKRTQIAGEHYKRISRMNPIDVAGDGNCGLRAVAVSLKLDQEASIDLFAKVIRSQRENLTTLGAKEALEEIRPSNETYYSMDDLALLCSAMQKSLVVVLFEQGEITRFQEMSESSDDTVYILLLGSKLGRNNHYNGLVE